MHVLFVSLIINCFDHVCTNDCMYMNLEHAFRQKNPFNKVFYQKSNNRSNCYERDTPISQGGGTAPMLRGALPLER